MSVTRVVKVNPAKTALFLCDLQVRIRDHIWGFDEVLQTTCKMVKAAQVLSIPVVVTEQHPKVFGPTVPEIQLDALAESMLHLGTFPKTKFGMVIPEVESIIKERNLSSVILVGIESHICVLQTTLDLLEKGCDVHVLADGVSSCNKEEVPIALARMRQAGAQITTSESILYQLMGDASGPTFKPFANIIKEEKPGTKKTLSVLLARDVSEKGN